MRKGDYAFFKSVGICPRCGKNPSEPHHVLCMECAGHENDKYHGQRNDDTYTKQQKDTERKRKTASERRAAGFCYRCGKHKTPAGGLCETCRAKAKGYRDKHRMDIARSERPAYGRCYICGEPVAGGKKVCEKCYQARIATLPAMWNHPNREYFNGLNNLLYINN